MKFAYRYQIHIVIGCLILYPVSGDPPNSGDVEKILDYHNNYRANVNPPSSAMMKLIWNSEGAEKADIWIKNCVFAHDSGSNRATSNYTSGGQNLYVSSNVPDWKDVVGMWHGEVSLFTYGSENNTFNDVGHYTQVVWGTTREIGCAMHTCPDFTLVACNYYPSGNFAPYYVPYQKSNVQSCGGCLEGGVCSKRGPYKGKLLEQCSLFCTNMYTNCDALAADNWCSYYENECALSCRKECKA